MNLNRHFICAFAALALIGCNDHQKRIDASNQSTFEESSKTVAEALSPDQKLRFTKALFALTIGDAVQSGGLADVANAFAPGNPLVSPTSPIHGKTAPEVIALAEAKIQQHIASLQSEIASAEKEAVKKRGVLDQIAITNPHFKITKNDYSSQSEVSFLLKNNGKIAIKRFFIHAILATPGRSVPWVDDSFNHEVSGGVEPGESQFFNLAPNSFSAWGRVDAAQAKDAVLTLELIDIEGPDGKRLITARADDLESKRGRLSIFEQQLKALKN